MIAEGKIGAGVVGTTVSFAVGINVVNEYLQAIAFVAAICSAIATTVYVVKKIRAMK